MVVELGSLQITAERLLNLKTGDVIQLNQDVSDRLVATVEGIPKFKGRVGVMRGNRALRIEERCSGGATDV